MKSYRLFLLCGLLAIGYVGYRVTTGDVRYRAATTLEAASPGSAVTLRPITAVGMKQPARQPHWFLLPDGKFGILWRYPTVVRPRNDDMMDFIPQIYTLIGFAYATQTGFRVSDAQAEVGPGQSESSDLAVVPSSAGRPCFLISQPKTYSRVSIVANASVRRLSDASNPDGDTLTIEAKDTALLPYDTTSPDWLKAYNFYVEQNQKLAQQTGHKIFFEEELDVKHGKVPAVGDVFIRREDVYTTEDFSHFSTILNPQGKIWLAGVDNFKQSQMWVIPCNDTQGKSWGARVMLGYGDYPSLIATTAQELILIYTRNHDPKGMLDNRPEYGPLMLRRSHDGGRTWGEPQPVVNDKRTVQSRALLGPDGRIWLAYAQYDTSQGVQLTSLWLTSSGDDGETWAQPLRLTDGKFLDREPDLAFRDGKLLIAFSRAGRGINTNIWLAQVNPKLVNP